MADAGPPSAIMQQVRREVLALESEYEALRRQLDQRQDELKGLKADKAARRRELRGNDTTSGAMVELMQEIGVINKQIQEATQQALSLDEKIDASKLGALQLEASEAEVKEELHEIHAQREGEEKKLADLQHKIAETQQELNARDADLQRLSVAMGQHATSLGVSSADHYSGQEKLAKDMGDLETLSAVLPQLDEDIAEAEEILRERNETLRARSHERDFLQQILEQIAFQKRPDSGLVGLDPQQNFEKLVHELERVREQATAVEHDAEEKRKEELRVAKQKSSTENESKRLASEIDGMRRQLEDREAQINELKQLLEELEHETATLEHQIGMKQEQLGRADQIEEWRMRRMLRRLEIQKQMKDRWKAEADKISQKARQVEQEELAALAAEAEQRDEAIKRKCDVYAMVPRLTGGHTERVRVTTTRTTTRTGTDPPRIDAPPVHASRGAVDGLDTDWEPVSRKTTTHTTRRTETSVRSSRLVAGSGAAESASVRLDGGTISSLADHTNPEVRAAARRVQSMYTDS